MARPTNQSRLDRAADEAENLIRNNVVELTRVAINTALLPGAKVKCAHCKKDFLVDGTSGDPSLILRLIERIAGKPTEKRESGVTGDLEKLLIGLAGAPESTEDTTAKQAAEAAKERARKRAQAAAILKGASATPEA